MIVISELKIIKALEECSYRMKDLLEIAGFSRKCCFESKKIFDDIINVYKNQNNSPYIQNLQEYIEKAVSDFALFIMPPEKAMFLRQQIMRKYCEELGENKQ